MYTLTALIQQARNLIGDTSAGPYFSDAELADFINRAINDLSLHFPRQAVTDLTTEAGVHEYDLGMDTLQVLSVEYPAGAAVPAYLERKGYSDVGFWESGRFYDWVDTGDADSTNPPRLVLGGSPPDGVAMRVVTVVEHRQLVDGSDECTLPDRYVHLIGLFVRWKCWQQLAVEEGTDPNPLEVLVANQEMNAERAEYAYRRGLKDAKASLGASGRVGWQMDRDRVY